MFYAVKVTIDGIGIATQLVPISIIIPKFWATHSIIQNLFCIFLSKIPIAGFRIVHFPQGGSKTIGGCNLYLIVRCCIIFVDAVCIPSSVRGKNIRVQIICRGLNVGCLCKIYFRGNRCLRYFIQIVIASSKCKS